MKSSGASVVGVTGSVGKSTTVATVVACLGPQRVLRLTRPRTTAVGLALDILNGLGSQRVIVAEMQLDGPNQLQLLTRSAVPTVGVITAIGSAHLERFGSRREIASAKLQMAELLAPQGNLVVNADDPVLTSWSSSREDVSVFRFGMHESCDLVMLRPRALRPYGECVFLGPPPRASASSAHPTTWLAQHGLSSGGSVRCDSTWCAVRGLMSLRRSRRPRLLAGSRPTRCSVARS